MFTRDFSSKDTMMRKIKDKSYFGVFTPILDKIVISVFFFSVSPVFSSLQLQNNCLCLGLRKHRGVTLKCQMIVLSLTKLNMFAVML